MTDRPSPISFLRLAAILTIVLMPLGLASAQDKLKDLQQGAVARKTEKISRAYHFGSQGAGDVFSNHASHSNRLIPVYTFGRKVDLGSVTGANSLYRDATKVKALYGFLPERTVNPQAEYADQSDLYEVQKDAVAKCLVGRSTFVA